MNLFENLFGGQQRQGAEDFLNRYQQGHPSEGYSEEEVMQHYQTATGSVPDDIYEQSARNPLPGCLPRSAKSFSNSCGRGHSSSRLPRTFPTLIKTESMIATRTRTS
jgi:hypothetical protein